MFQQTVFDLARADPVTGTGYHIVVTADEP
jgi:hypothetical protein